MLIRVKKETLINNVSRRMLIENIYNHMKRSVTLVKNIKIYLMCFFLMCFFPEYNKDKNANKRR